MNFFQSIGHSSLKFLAKLGRSSLFFSAILTGFGYTLSRPGLLIKQLYNIGVLTFWLIAISGLFVGMVLGLQGVYTLSTFGAESSLGIMVAASLVRELGPVVSALLFAGRAGSALTAEIGLMKATEQLSAMEMMAIDPLKYIIAPRFFAGFISLPLLAALFSAIGILGGYLAGVELLNVDSGSYWSQMQGAIDFHDDIINGVIKSIIFAWLVSWIALFEGYDAVPTASGISRATTRTVVTSAFAILLFDFLLTALMFGAS
ncbi:MAG TPA: lipid asymmetry maintenance ABC transporter permease subunit MlaE [Methyloprofundus sp.]|nr:lipid asymmetry maintenance ABC transporter permease subunit MlaE [Gammaproteobacteria bacterium]HIG64868.1 lipid asymmetry maintenance ABC transporter permease subunit MlaE [Methyloprofundus sp.]HIL78274.1 lipid asymmetry maintenance ABC transporter permease subunit MlaE [Methylococcales bacterium]MBT5824900.1 lipid asymmetry maintenance ABC transporter permease subunit MlaE [Gammaproteobacteria bacterium]MBT5967053.1 lipid asymmetry maintenance ABC transporter permease subunit MlaE [Gammap